MRKVVVAVVVVTVLFVGAAAWRGYGRLVSLDKVVRAQWGQVEGAYQRRAELIPQVVQVVSGTAGFEADRSTMAEARARVDLASAPGAARLLDDARALARFDEAQQLLGAALARVMAGAPESRELKERFAAIEERIAVERTRFNEAAQQFNTRRQSVPTLIVAGVMGGRYEEKAYFR